MTALAVLFGTLLAVPGCASGSAEMDAHASARRAELVVDPAGAIRTVGEAVRCAHPGDRIVVMPGTYREPTIVIDRPLVLEGQSWPVLDGEGERAILVVRADDVTVRGLELRNVGVSFVEDLAAIEVRGARRCAIERNRVRNAFFGIYLAEAADCVIRGNEITGSAEREVRSGNGIHLWYSRNVRIENNVVRGHRDGIYFEFVEDTRVAGNTSEDNLRYGLHFMFSDRCRYVGNEFRRNGAGVAVMYTKHVEIADNRFEENFGSAAFGLLMKDITDSRVERNLFRRNSVGIHAEGFDRTEVRGNVFDENGRAIRLLADSEGSEFIGNDFRGNTFDVTTNSRRTRSAFRGNYWDTYAGYDLDHDGTGDVPHLPVRLFSLVVETTPPATLLQRSFFVTLLDWAERLAPSLTPDNLQDPAPAMRPVAERAERLAATGNVGTSERTDRRGREAER